MKKQFWNFKNISASEGELMLYGEIAESSWYADTISSEKFAKDLKGLGAVTNITVRINSGGGDVFAGHAIYQMLKDHSAKIIARVEGLAASAASVILMSGDTIIVPEGAFIMIHNPSASASGEAKDLTKMAEILSVIKNGIVNIYASKTGKDKKIISKMMDDQTWMTGEDAVREGFADKVEAAVANKAPILKGNTLIANNLSFDLSKFKTRPSLEDAMETNSDTISLIDKIIESFKDKTRAETKRNININNVDDLKRAYPELINQMVKKQFESEAPTVVAIALKNERARLQAIDEIAKNIDQALVYKAKYEEPIDARELAFINICSKSK